MRTTYHYGCQTEQIPDILGEDEDETTNEYVLINKCRNKNGARQCQNTYGVRSKHKKQNQEQVLTQRTTSQDNETHQE